MTRVLLIFPTIYGDPEMKEVYFPLPPLGLAYLASSLEKAGHTVSIFDVLGRDKQIEKVINDFKPEIIGIECYSTGFISFKDIVIAIRKVFNGLIVAGGPHVTAVKEVQKELPVDYWVKGDGEKTIVKLADGWRPDNKVIIGEEIDDLDSLPFPAWHLLEFEKYKKNISLGGMPIISSRGCPYRCIFCFDAHVRKLNFRGSKNVVAEMLEIKKKYGISKFSFMDDTFVVSEKRIKEFADLLEGSGIEFVCNGRCNIMTEAIMKDLKRAGCILIYYGVESGVQRILDIMQKRITIEQIINSLELTKKYKIKSSIFILMSNPTETVDEMYETIRFSKDLYKKYKCIIDLSILYCYPGTPVYDMKGLDIKDWSIKQHNWKYPSVPIYIEEGHNLDEILGLYKKFVFDLNFLLAPKHKLVILGMKYIFRNFKKKLRT